MSTVVNLGIRLQEPLTRPGVKVVNEKTRREDEHLLFDSARSRGMYNFLLAGK